MQKDYKQAWEKLKKRFEEYLKYYKDGTMCSMSENIIGEQVCKMVLDEMKGLMNE